MNESLNYVHTVAPIVPVLISLIADLATGHDPENDIIVKRSGDNSL